MSVFEDGYFGLNLEDDTPIMKVIDKTILSFALLIQLVIGFITIHKLKANRKINGSLNCLFVSSLCFACTFTIGGLADGGDSLTAMIIECITVVAFGYFFQSLLWTFVIRLHITFKRSQYRMSSLMMTVFKVIILFELFGWIIFCTFFVFMEDTVDPLISFSLGFSLLFLYIIGSALAVYYFVRNMAKMAKARMTSPKALPSKKDVKLDRQQENIARLAAKYSMLFAFGIFSTVLMNLLSYSVNIGSGLRAPILTLDLCINLFAVYLQFSFAEGHYNKCCRCCDEKCTNFVSNRTRTLIFRHSISLGTPSTAESGLAEHQRGNATRNIKHHSTSSPESELAEHQTP